MFDGGGVPIDHYIIQVDNGTQLETPGPTYSFDIMYNTTLSVNISAHNCAGYSDPFPLPIVYDPGLVLHICKGNMHSPVLMVIHRFGEGCNTQYDTKTY